MCEPVEPVDREPKLLSSAPGPRIIRPSFDLTHFNAGTSSRLAKLRSPQHHNHLHSPPPDPNTSIKMSPQSILRASPRMANLMGRRMFHATRARLSSPYHYPEGPYSNLPFNTKTRFFAVRYWLYCITGFFAPFGIAVWQTYKPKA